LRGQAARRKVGIGIGRKRRGLVWKKEGEEGLRLDELEGERLLMNP
jgi:hypothetical protein